MKPEIRRIIEEQKAGKVLNSREIKLLMIYALELLNDIKELTEQNIEILKGKTPS